MQPGSAYTLVEFTLRNEGYLVFPDGPQVLFHETPANRQFVSEPEYRHRSIRIGVSDRVFSTKV